MTTFFSSIRRGVGLGMAALGAVAFLPPLVTRLVLGQAFVLTGRGKIENFDNTIQFFSELGIPFPELNAAFVSRLEFYGGWALVLGLLTRVVAAGLASTMVVALLTADREVFVSALRMTGEQGLTDVVPFVYLIFLVWLVISGPGAVSLDAFLARWVRLGTRETPAPALEPATR